MNQIYTYRDAEFGDVAIHPKRQARQIIFRVKDGKLVITSPIGYRVGDVQAVVETNRARLRKLFDRVAQREQRQVVAVGDRIPYYGGEVEFLPGIEGRGFLFQYQAGRIEVRCPSGYDLNDAPVWDAVSKYVNRFVKMRAQELLPQRLEAVAKRLDVKPVAVSIGRGKNKLGHCTSRGEIQLSYRLMFYPEEIIDYIICHELAHLTHLNHSPEFHALCNRYCNGREAELRRQARNFKVLFR